MESHTNCCESLFLKVAYGVMLTGRVVLLINNASACGRAKALYADEDTAFAVCHYDCAGDTLISRRRSPPPAPGGQDDCKVMRSVG